ncbi:phosphoglycerate kinase [Seohaeicola zhoushanensis]|uniref:Uncharacterized protein n=1 Tax=Seohaeicola zhoushanensis TaxID=1569283 RepID=A0A8J3MC15_9RHOB|nr:phosphoglycerate kinase [Seohaeicola zhoushanensis]GHF70152.1 hypothetical protein GCM10017056_46500 [Seohaeicola zhoushanensis]
MGLDMYAKITAEKLDTEVDFTVTESTEIHYWRKHPDLHGWMEQLYFDKGGSADCFNCVGVVLTAFDLDRLEKAIHAKELPDTAGFFFGDSDGSECDDDLAFIAKARQAIVDGYTVYYDSWW